MPKLIVCAVMDRAVQTFNRPFYVPAVGAATRSFMDEVNRAAADNPMYAHPDDFELWRLATYDDETGLFEDQAARMLTRGKDVREA